MNIAEQLAKEEKRLKILAWKWTSIDNEGQHFREIMDDVFDLMGNDLWDDNLRETWNQINNINWDSIELQTIDFHTEVFRLLSELNREYPDVCWDNESEKFQCLNINEVKFNLCMEIHDQKWKVHNLQVDLETHKKRLETIQSTLRSLQRDVNST